MISWWLLYKPARDWSPEGHDGIHDLDGIHGPRSSAALHTEGTKVPTKFQAIQEVVVVVYLTTNQRHMGYLSSGNGHLAGRYSTP